MMSPFRSSRLDAITLLAGDHPSPAPAFFHRAIFVQSRSGSATFIVPPGNGRVVARLRLTIFGPGHPRHMGRKAAACKQTRGELRTPNRHLPSMKGHVKNFSVTAGARLGACLGSGFAVVILMICAHSAQHNVQGSARAVLPGNRRCIDMLISLPVADDGR